MRVALHVVAGPLGGPRTYGIALARALARRDDLDLTVLTDRPEAFPGIRSVKLPRMRPLADHVVAPAVLQRLQPDVYHNTKNALPFVAPCPTVVTVHDLRRACKPHKERLSEAQPGHVSRTHDRRRRQL